MSLIWYQTITKQEFQPYLPPWLRYRKWVLSIALWKREHRSWQQATVMSNGLNLSQPSPQIIHTGKI